MNIQAMMKQAQQLQKDITTAKAEINGTTYTGSSSFVSVEMKGDKKITKVKIDKESLSSDEIEMLEDMLLVAVNNTLQKIDVDTEQKLGKYTKGMPGLF